LYSSELELAMGKPGGKRKRVTGAPQQWSAWLACGVVVIVLAAVGCYYTRLNEHFSKDTKRRETIVTYNGGFPYAMYAPMDPIVGEVLQTIGDKTLKGHVPEADYMQGLLAIDDALIDEPADVDLHLQRAQMLFELGSFEDSSQAIVEAIKNAATPDDTSKIMQRTLVYPPVCVASAISPS
jgi:hypothetical protein